MPQQEFRVFGERSPRSGQPGWRTASRYRWVSPASGRSSRFRSPSDIPPIASSPGLLTAAGRGACHPAHDARSLLSQLHPESLHAPQREDQNNASIPESGTDAPLGDSFQHATPADGPAIDAALLSATSPPPANLPRRSPPADGALPLRHKTRHRLPADPPSPLASRPVTLLRRSVPAPVPEWHLPTAPRHLRYLTLG